MGIEKKFPKSSNEVFLTIFHYVQKWGILLKDQDSRFVEDKFSTE